MYSSVILNETYNHFDPFNVLNVDTLETFEGSRTTLDYIDSFEQLDTIQDVLDADDITYVPDVEFDNQVVSSIFEHDESLSSRISIILNEEDDKLTQRKGRHPQIVDFLLKLLSCSKTNPSLIRWENPEDGTFKFINPEKVSKLWGKRGPRKNKDKEMDFGKFSRAIRYHYSHGNFVPVRDQKLVYKFGPNVKVWRTETKQSLW